MGLSVEASEVLEHFQWLTGRESADLPTEKKEALRLELADVFIYLIRLADTLDVDLVDAARDKLIVNADALIFAPYAWRIRASPFSFVLRHLTPPRDG
jgi:NTP pyrophosphatase (non-canonical NTP hydrolase)